ncbi:MAG TPA: cation:dicarboxylase symporter family transporter [Vicinamibacterales bacterium]|jgi:proton glutamate symport protein|nr:cation:dicarboxylase symporter family transporter [Vicinamibacterales bacterium]
MRQAEAGAVHQPAPPSRMPGLTTQIFIGLLLGIVVGYLWPGFGLAVKPLADAFLRMIKMIIAPLIFATLVVGIAGTGDLKTMGRIGLKAIVYFEIATTVALFVGLALVNVFKPGAGLTMPIGGNESAVAAMAQNQQHAWDIFLHLFPTSVIDAMARGDILQLVVFSIFFGIALAAVGAKGRPLVELLESTAQVMFKFTAYVMAFAPIGVFAAIAATVGGKGLGILLTLGKLVVLMYTGLAVVILVVVAGTAILIRVPFFTFLKAVREPFLIAFTTASSEAALPSALTLMERFGVPNHIVAFVLPTGYSFNLTGTTLYLSLASVFVAQLAGVPMTFGQQLVMMLTLMLTSKGVAGVPRAALVVLTATLTQFGLPLEGAAILLGIDQIMDMGRTAVNVMGNCIATVVVARWEGVFDDAQMRTFSADEVSSPAA